MTEPHTLDYRPRLVEANRRYRITAADPQHLTATPRYWTPGHVLDQGREGACVGYGVVAEALASPARVRTWHDPHYGDRPMRDAATLAAQRIYRAAQLIDEWEGENYEGTSVRAGMLIGRDHRWWTGFGWAFSMTELRAALEHGPVVIGVEWSAGMYQAPNGILTPNGATVGGHCLLVTGYTPRRPHLGPAYRLRNSWGADWGHRGNAYIHADHLERILFTAGGEAAVPLGRTT